MDDFLIAEIFRVEFFDRDFSKTTRRLLEFSIFFFFSQTFLEVRPRALDAVKTQTKGVDFLDGFQRRILAFLRGRKLGRNVPENGVEGKTKKKKPESDRTEPTTFDPKRSAKLFTRNILRGRLGVIKPSINVRKRLAVRFTNSELLFTEYDRTNAIVYACRIVVGARRFIVTFEPE